MRRTGKGALAAVGLVATAALLARPSSAFSPTLLRAPALSQRAVAASRRAGRCGVADLRASLNDPVEGGADGSLEKMLGNIGLGKVGKSIDWFFDTSTISGAKAWRLQEIPGEADATRFRGKSGSATTGDDLEEMLQDQISSRTLDREALQAAMAGDEDFFSDAGVIGNDYSLDDADLSGALTARLQQLDYSESQQADLITGAELAFLCYKKYGLYHDMALKCDMLQLVSDKKLVSVNIYYAYYGQLNPRFQYSEAEYLQKCDLIASAINQWGQAAFVREFFAEPPRAYRGLPSRPRWDTAVSIRLYKSPTWTGAGVEEWFYT